MDANPPPPLPLSPEQQAELDRWRAERADAIMGLRRLVEQRKLAIWGLQVMAKEDWSIPVPTGVVSEADVQGDTTHMVTAYNDWVRVVNGLTTNFGIVQITQVMKNEIGWIDGLMKGDKEFLGGGNEASAWYYLECVNAYLAQSRADQLLMDRA